jgi:hypothetical protein
MSEHQEFKCHTPDKIIYSNPRLTGQNIKTSDADRVSLPLFKHGSQTGGKPAIGSDNEHFLHGGAPGLQKNYVGCMFSLDTTTWSVWTHFAWWTVILILYDLFTPLAKLLAPYYKKVKRMLI